jgi:hypothetical protein
VVIDWDAPDSHGLAALINAECQPSRAVDRGAISAGQEQEIEVLASFSLPLQ